VDRYNGKDYTLIFSYGYYCELIMKIGIDARMVGSGYGLGRYVEQLLKYIAQTHTNHTFVVFVRNETGESFIPKDKRFTTVIADIAWYSFREQLFFSKIIVAQHLDLMHFPHWNIPMSYRMPFVMTLHDLTMFHFSRPESTTHSRAIFFIKDHAHRLVIRQAVKHATHILTTSEFTRNDVHDTLSVPLGKMTTVYQAPFLSDAPKIEDCTLKKYFISKPYVLYVGAAYPHKNLDGLLSAWKLYQEKYSTKYSLVLVGKENYFYTRLLKKIKIQEINNVIYTGFVTDKELVGLYDHARAFIFPSLYEGFGLPPLEALARGVPVLSSDRSCLPEVLGEAALYVDPENNKQFADALNRITTNEDIRYALLQNGKHELQRYSLDKSVIKILSIYDSALM